jgi:hypothetical protein
MPLWAWYLGVAVVAGVSLFLLDRLLASEIYREAGNEGGDPPPSSS